MIDHQPENKLNDDRDQPAQRETVIEYIRLMINSEISHNIGNTEATDTKQGHDCWQNWKSHSSDRIDDDIQNTIKEQEQRHMS